MSFVYECFHLVNLPFTLLLLVFVLYWAMVVIGAIGIDALDFDMETSGLDFDVDFDADVDVDADVGSGTGTGGGTLHWFLRFLNVGDVPVMIVASAGVVALWATMMLANHYANPELVLWVSVLWFLPNLLISVVFAKYTTLPFRGVFRHLDAGVEAKYQFVGKTCRVKSAHVSSEMGQAELYRDDGVQLLINIKTQGGETLEKGDDAIIASRDSEKDIYYVTKAKKNS